MGLQSSPVLTLDKSNQSVARFCNPTVTDVPYPGEGDPTILQIPGAPLTTGATLFLILALGLALAFEFVNGFHDTANAVATVIYTRTLRPSQAVLWSGMWNLIGVLTSSGAVAFGVLSLLP